MRSVWVFSVIIGHWSVIRQFSHYWQIIMGLKSYFSNVTVSKGRSIKTALKKMNAEEKEKYISKLHFLCNGYAVTQILNKSLLWNFLQVCRNLTAHPCSTWELRWSRRWSNDKSKQCLIHRVIVGMCWVSCVWLCHGVLWLWYGYGYGMVYYGLLWYSMVYPGIAEHRVSAILKWWEYGQWGASCRPTATGRQLYVQPFCQTGWTTGNISTRGVKSRSQIMLPCVKSVENRRAKSCIK